MCPGWELGGVLNGAEGMGWDEMRWDETVLALVQRCAVPWHGDVGPQLIMGGRGVRDPWINFHRLQTLGEEACAEDDSLEGCWMVPKGWDEMRWDETVLALVQRCAVPWHGDVGPQLIHGWSGGQRPLEINFHRLQTLGEEAWQLGGVLNGAKGMRWDEMRWDSSCFGAAMCSAMAWGRGPSINPWVVGGSETLGLISRGCRHWVKKHVQRMTAWRGAEWCRRDEMRWDEMRWDCACFGAAMCSAMAWGRGPSINPWVAGGSETLGLIFDRW